MLNKFRKYTLVIWVQPKHTLTFISVQYIIASKKNLFGHSSASVFEICKKIIRELIFSAALIFMQPFMYFAAEISASWQH
jgi:hypothetical protein